MASKLILQNLFCNQAIQVAVPTNLSTVTASSTTSILLLKPAGTLPLSVTIQFPASPTNGQLFTIILGSALALTVINNGNGASIANGLTAFSLGIGSVAATTYLYYAPDNTWYNY